MTNATTATFDFQSPNTNPVTFKCSLDGAAVTDCTSPKVYTGLNGRRSQVRGDGVQPGGEPRPRSCRLQLDDRHDRSGHDVGGRARPPPRAPALRPSRSPRRPEPASSAGSTGRPGSRARRRRSTASSRSASTVSRFAPSTRQETGTRLPRAGRGAWCPRHLLRSQSPSGPSLINPFPVIRIAGTITSRGVRLRLFLVNAPSGSKVVVRCLARDVPSRRRAAQPRRYVSGRSKSASTRPA